MDMETKRLMMLKKLLLTVLMFGVALVGVPALAAPEDAPTAGAMAADIIVARPLGVVFTIVGTTIFVVSLPFSALGGNVGAAAKALVVKPVQETFVRCLGCRTAGRSQY